MFKPSIHSCVRAVLATVGEEDVTVLHVMTQVDLMRGTTSTGAVMTAIVNMQAHKELAVTEYCKGWPVTVRWVAPPSR